VHANLLVLFARSYYVVRSFIYITWSIFGSTSHHISSFWSPLLTLQINFKSIILTSKKKEQLKTWMNRYKQGDWFIKRTVEILSSVSRKNNIYIIYDINEISRQINYKIEKKWVWLYLLAYLAYFSTKHQNIIFHTLTASYSTLKWNCYNFHFV